MTINPLQTHLRRTANRRPHQKIADAADADVVVALGWMGARAGVTKKVVHSRNWATRRNGLADPQNLPITKRHRDFTLDFSDVSCLEQGLHRPIFSTVITSFPIRRRKPRHHHFVIDHRGSEALKRRRTTTSLWHLVTIFNSSIG